MHALVSGKARIGARTLLARASGVWMWPGIALTVAADVARFWISRLHGPEANDSAVLRCLGIAALKLSEGDEAGAQTALDASGLTRLSPDGAVVARAVASALGIAPLDLPWAGGPRLWRTEDIAAHLPLFKDYAPAAGLLAKAGLGTNRSTRACRQDRARADSFNRAGAVAALRKSRQKFRRWTRLQNRCATLLRSWRRGGWRARWRPLLLGLRESLSSHWKRRRKPPYGFTTNIHLSKPISMAQSRSKSFKMLLESLGKGTMFTILWSRRPREIMKSRMLRSMGWTISSASPD
jgi:hypothetical protein